MHFCSIFGNFQPFLTIFNCSRPSLKPNEFYFVTWCLKLDSKAVLFSSTFRFEHFLRSENAFCKTIYNFRPFSDIFRHFRPISPVFSRIWNTRRFISTHDVWDLILKLFCLLQLFDLRLVNAFLFKYWPFLAFVLSF